MSSLTRLEHKLHRDVYITSKGAVVITNIATERDQDATVHTGGCIPASFNHHDPAWDIRNWLAGNTCHLRTSHIMAQDSPLFGIGRDIDWVWSTLHACCVQNMRYILRISSSNITGGRRPFMLYGCSASVLRTEQNRCRFVYSV